MALRTPDTPEKDRNRIDENYARGLDSSGSNGIYQRGKDRLDSIALRDRENREAAAGAGEKNSVRDREEQGGGANYESKFTGKKQPSREGGWRENMRAKLTGVKKKGPAGAIIVFILLLLFGGAGFFGAALAPIAWVSNITLDLYDPLSALEERGSIFKAEKIRPGNATSFGCSSFGSKLPIKCKYVTVSEKMVERYKGAGIEITGEKSFGNRIKPTEFKFNNKTYTAEQFMEETRRPNSDLAKAYRQANRMSFLGMSGPAFVNKTLGKWGLKKRPPALEGDVDERLNQLSNRTDGGTINDNLKFVDAIDPETGEVLLDDQDRPLKRLAGDPDGDLWTQDDINNKKSKNIERIRSIDKPLLRGGLGALNALGAYDTGCSLIKAVGQASTAVKVANAAQLAEYAMPIASLADEMKSGYISNENAQVIQRFMNDTDARKTIAAVTADGGAEEIPNPDFGKSAMDSELYKMSSNGGVAHTSVADTRYSLGFGVNSLARKADSFARAADAIANIGSVGVCDKVQSWWGRLGGFVAGIFLGGVTFGGFTGANLAINAGMIVFSFFLDDILNAVLSANLISDSMSEAPVEKGSAAWTGMAAIHSQHALSRGMMPGNAEQIVAYQAEQNEARQKYIAYERQQSNPLDIKNPYSITGSIALAVHNRLPSNLSLSTLASAPGNISSFVFGGLTSILKPSSAQAAAPTDPERFKQCDDAAYSDIGIDADVQCNVRYIMPESSMQHDPLEVAQWMEDEGWVEENTTTGFPEGYTPPSEEDNHNIAMSIVIGQIDQIYNTRQYGDDDYKKFLDFCVYRTLPFGETFDENGSFGDAEPEWKSGEKCMDTEDEKINYFRMYVFDMSVNDDLDEAPIISNVDCGPATASSSAGSALGKASAEDINAAIEASEKANNTTSPLHGKGAEIIELSNQYGVNSDLIVVTLHAETQFGTDGALGPQYNNFGYNKLNEFNECDPFTIGSDQYNCYNTPEAGIEGVLKNLTENEDYRGVGSTAPPGTKPNTIASVRTIYCPEGDGNCNLESFLASGELIGIPISGDDPVFSSSSGSTTPSSGGISTNSGSVGGKMSQTEFEQQLASYGLPAPTADGEKGYKALLEKLKSDQNAGWAAQQLLNGEKNFKSKGGEIKEYLTTAWIWFETGTFPDPYEVNCMSNTKHPTNQTCAIGTSPDKVQVAGYQAWDVRHRFQEIYKMFYSEGELESILQRVIDNSSKASIEEWKYNVSEATSRIKGATLADIYAESGVGYPEFNNDKTQFLSFMLGKDPNMAAALNSFAVSDGDVVAMLRDCTSLSWSNNSYYCDPALRPYVSNIMMALYLFDGQGPAGDASCISEAGRSLGSGVGIAAVWGGEGEKDLSYGFDYGPAAGPWYSYATAYGMSGTTHTGTDIPMDPYAPVYSPVEGIVVCERNGVGDGIPGAGCAGAGDYSGPDSEWEACRQGYDSSKPRGAGTVMIKMSNGDAIRLGHLASSLVKLGDKVTPNQQIGTAGCMNGWHTHVEYFIPAPGETSSGLRLVDPVEYLGGNTNA